MRSPNGVPLAVLRIQVQGRRVHGEGAEQQIVRLGDGAPHGVLESLPDLELLEIQSGHACAPRGPSLTAPTLVLHAADNRKTRPTKPKGIEASGAAAPIVGGMYRYDELDQALVDERVDEFRDQTRRYLAGELSEDEFRPLRLRNGLYIQRHAPMLRIAIPYGLLSSRAAAHARRSSRGATTVAMAISRPARTCS